MSKEIRIISPSRETKDGERTKNYDQIPDIEKSILVSGGEVKEKNVFVRPGMTIDALFDECNVESEKQKAIYFGWPTGRFVELTNLKEQRIPACETAYIVSQKECMADVMFRLAENMKKNSCGRCVFCRETTFQLHLIAQDIVHKKGKRDDLAKIRKLFELSGFLSSCSYGISASESVLSLLNMHEAEIDAHIAKKNCPAGVCKAFLEYYIDPTICTGCGECVDVCEEDAIEGKNRFIHILDQDMCEKCGACVDACDENAIVTASGKLPRLPVKPILCGRWK